MSRKVKNSQTRKTDVCRSPNKQLKRNAGKGVKRTARRPAKETFGESPLDARFWNLRLYVAGQTSRSMRALNNLNKLCSTHLAGRYRIEVIDLVKQPKLAIGDQIVATPTVVRKLPVPIRQIVGDLSNMEKALVGMGLRQRPWDDRHER